MSKKKTHEEYLIQLESMHLLVAPLEIYNGAANPISHKCLVCGHKWEVKPSNILSGKGCPKCAIKERSDKERKSETDYANEVLIQNKHVIYVSGYKGAKIPCKHKCLYCGNEVDMMPTHVLNGSGCKDCSAKRNGAKQRKTHEQFMKDVFPNLNSSIKILGKYKDSKTKIDCLCITCGKPIKMWPKELMKGSGCQRCSAKLTQKKQSKTQEQFETELSILKPNIHAISTYEGANNLMRFQCKTNPEHIWWATPNNVLKKSGCPKCADIIGGIKKKQFALNKYRPIFKKGNLSIIGEYKGTEDETLFKCLICETEFMARPHAISQGQKGCPVCTADSAGERVIFQYLYKNKIRFTPEKTFDDLTGLNNGLLRYDFYLPDYNLLIEFHGAQHESPKYGYFGGDEGFEIRHTHDMMKEEYAKQHGIKFLVIWYYDFDNIEQILKDNLNSESVETVIMA